MPSRHSIPCDCGKYYVGETSRSLEVRLKEHRYNLTHGLFEKSKLVQHVYEEGHRICWNEAKVLQIEPNTTYKEYKESACMSLVDHPISQPSLDTSRIWFFLCWYHTENFISPVKISLLIILWCKASYV
jgi:predicted GIY-YIG superfamily endonuclease